MVFASARTEQSPQDISLALDIRHKHIGTHLPFLRTIKFSKIPSESDRYATFIDVKRTPYTEFALRNIMFFLGDDWGLQIFVPPEMEIGISNIVKDWHDVHINTLDPGSYETGQNLLNARLREPELWQNMRGEWQLIFNSDSMLCRHGVEEYMQYDYIGAPWPDFVVSPWCRVGSGGLSLRRKEAMLDICHSCNNNPWVIGPEEIFFSINLHLNPEKYQLPSLTAAQKFCVERLYCPRPFAVHRPWHYISARQLSSVFERVDYGGRHIEDQA